MRQLWHRLIGWWWRQSRRSWDSYPARVFRTGLPVGVPLEPYLKRFARGDARPGQRAYQIWLTEGYSWDGVWNVWRDGHRGFILSAGFRAVGAITWDDESEDVICITQVQGKSGSAELMRPLRWEKLLYQIVLDWAAANGKRQVRVRPAARNKWYDERRAGRMRMLYDVTARRMGFRPDAGGEYFCRDVTPA